MLSTKWKWSPSIYCGLISSMSLRFSSHMMISTIPARLAAKIFSLIPPTGSTLPRRVISPVMAVLARTLRCVRAETIAVTIVIPAEGPSLGVAPSGTCT
ncbi:membrane-associated protein [gut metagenome]|uniref:Membrane-associated protein n=1 Tax=gut metagenome TaxID=749906 RepID=J9GLV6_9ZZZZ